jgi:UDP-3-O-[3-hydroxymyristoyl] glucosamine N-acyltransferase
MTPPFLSEEPTVSPCGPQPLSLRNLALWGNAERMDRGNAECVEPANLVHPNGEKDGENSEKSTIQRDTHLAPCDESVSKKTPCGADYDAKNGDLKTESGTRPVTQGKNTHAPHDQPNTKPDTQNKDMSHAEPGANQITDLSRDFADAQPHQVTFLADEYRRPLGNKPLVTSAGACFVKAQDAHLLPPHTAALITPRPYRSFVQVLRFLDARRTEPPSYSIHHSAHIHASAQIDLTCQIGPGVIIEKNVIVHPHARIGACTHIGENVVIGHSCSIGTHVSIEHSTIGDHVHIQSGARIGHIGFGFVIDDHGFLEIPHQGKVILGNHVHIGANTTISRGSFTNTLIGNHTRIDALVQIAHNVHIGQHVVIASQCGIAGSCHLGDHCFLGGQVGLANGVVLAAGTKIAAKSGVMHSTHTAETLAGIPAVPAQQWRRSVVLLAKWCKKMDDC